MQRNGKNEHKDAVEPLVGPPLGAVGPAARQAYHLIRAPHKQRAGQEAQRGHQPGGQARGGLRALDGGLKQRPEAGRDHHTGGKAQH